VFPEFKIIPHSAQPPLSLVGNIISLCEEFALVVARDEQMWSLQAESERQVEGLFESMLSENFGG